MSCYTPVNTFVSQLYKERDLLSFAATQEQLQIAKMSLIYKKKCASNVHSILFCKSLNSNISELTTQNQKKILQQQKQKYFEYIRKSYSQKISQDFESQNKLKRAIKSKIKQRQQSQTKNEDKWVKRVRPTPTISANAKTKQEPASANVGHKSKKIKTQSKVPGGCQNPSPGQNPSQEQIAQQNFQSSMDLHIEQADESFIQEDE